METRKYLESRPTEESRLHGILGHLLITLNEETQINLGKGDFLYLVTNEPRIEAQYTPFGMNNNPATFGWDFIPKSKYKTVLNALCNQNDFKERFQLLLGTKDTDTSIISKFSHKMKNIIKKINVYSLKRVNGDVTDIGNACAEYNADTKKQLLTYFENDISSVTLTDYIYVITYWAMLKILPPLFFFELNYRKQLAEFNTKVVRRYGVNSMGGRRVLLELSNSNIFAMYEVGNLYYFGMRYDQKPDLNRALYYFKKSAGFNEKGEFDQSKCNPLALWIISYMYRTYRKDLDLKNLEYNAIPEIERLTDEERTRTSIDYCQKATELNRCIPAYNLLGLISKSMTTEERIAYKLKNPEEYYLRAAKQGYPYAYNNLAEIEKEKIFTISRSHLDKYLEYLSASAELDEPWACRKLGQFYLNGKIILQDLEYPFPTKKNPKKSYDYFQKAVSAYNNESSAISYAYLLVHFTDRYSSVDEMEGHLLSCCSLKYLDALKYLFENINDGVLHTLSDSVKEIAYQTLQMLKAEDSLLELAKQKLNYHPNNYL